MCSGGSPRAQVQRLDRRLHPVLPLHLPAGEGCKGCAAATAFLLLPLPPCLPAAAASWLCACCLACLLRRPANSYLCPLCSPTFSIHSSRCGSARASTTRAAPPSCTASASKRPACRGPARRRRRAGSRRAGPRPRRLQCGAPLCHYPLPPPLGSRSCSLLFMPLLLIELDDV